MNTFPIVLHDAVRDEVIVAIHPEADAAPAIALSDAVLDDVVV